MSKSELLFFPQSYLVHYVAFTTPRDGPKEPPEPYGFLDPRIKISRPSLSKKYMNLAKISSIYHPEAVFSKIMTTGQEPKKIDKHFLNIDNHKLSALTPELRLYRVNKEEKTVRPFYFATVSDYNFVGVGTGNLLDLGKPHTSNAAGIQNFSVKLTGKNPFQASRKFLEATLTVKVDSIAMLFDLPTGFEGTHAPLADLFTIRTAQETKTAGSNKKKPGGVLEKGKSCQIAATLGYAPHRTDIFSSKELAILRKTFQVINLFYSSHNLSMEQDGSATISVKYTGFLDALAGASEYDFISSIKSKARLQKARASGSSEEEKPKQSLSDMLSNKSTSTIDAEDQANSTTPDEVFKPTAGDIMSAFKQLFDTLYNNAKIHVMPTDDIAMRKKVLLGNQNLPEPTSEQIKANASINKTWRVSNLTKISEAEAKSSKVNPFEFINKSYVPYVALGDLLDAYFKKIGDDLTKVIKSVQEDKSIKDQLKTKLRKKMSAHFEELKNLNVFMSDIVYTKKQEGATEIEERKINIADIPVSIPLFYGMIYEKITSKRSSFYDMHGFMTSFIPMLLTRAFGELPGADVLNPITFATTTYTSSELSPGSINESGKVSVRVIPSPIQVASKKGVKKQSEYIILHQEVSNHTKSLGKGDKEEDLKNGIYHLRASQNSGIVKKISFSRIPSPAREAYMITRNGNIYDELRFAHNATVEMVGNNMFYPSCIVYINPESLGFGDPRGPRSAARRLGFGGYYMVGDVNTTFSEGQLTTTLSLHFNSFPEETSAAPTGGEEKKSIKDLQTSKK